MYIQWNVESGVLTLNNKGDSLESDIITSLFTDARAKASDVVEDNNRRGWWGCELTGLYGSRLWLLEREKQLEIITTRAQEYAVEALQWLISARKVKRVDVVASANQGILTLAITVQVTESDSRKIQFNALLNNS